MGLRSASARVYCMQICGHGKCGGGADHGTGIMTKMTRKMGTMAVALAAASLAGAGGSAVLPEAGERVTVPTPQAPSQDQRNDRAAPGQRSQRQAQKGRSNLTYDNLPAGRQPKRRKTHPNRPWLH
jgi:hypothetical protein